MKCDFCGQEMKDGHECSNSECLKDKVNARWIEEIKILKDELAHVRAEVAKLNELLEIKFGD